MHADLRDGQKMETRMTAPRTNEPLPSATHANVVASPGSVDLATPPPKTEPAYMQDAERKSHGVAANAERYAFYLFVLTATLIGAVAAWFYFHG
jgi:hypothetical protein